MVVDMGIMVWHAAAMREQGPGSKEGGGPMALGSRGYKKLGRQDGDMRARRGTLTATHDVLH